MAVLTDTSVIPLGDRSNRKQSIVMIPAQAVADKPGILVLQDVDDSGVVGEHYLWFDSTGVIRYHTSIPTDQDSDGTVVTSGTSGATTTLNNIASVAIPVTIASDAVNTDDLGTDALPWRSAYLGTNLVFDRGAQNNMLLAGSDCATAARTITFADPGANVNVVYDTTSQALTTKTYNGLTVVAGSNAISLTQGTATIAVAAAGDLNVGAGGDVDFGTGAIQFVGTAAFDQATGTTVDINANLTIAASTPVTISGGAAVAIDQSLATTDAPGFATGVTVGTLTLADGSITDSGGTIDFGNENLVTGGNITIDVDGTSSVGRLGFGVAGTSDAYVEFDGSTLNLWDTTSGPWTLEELATGTTLNPSVTGNLTVGEGYFRCDNTADETSHLKRNNATGTGAVFEIEETNAAGGVAFLVDSNHTGAVDAMEITYDGTAYGLDITTTAVTGGALVCRGGAGTERMVHFDGVTGSWVGKADEGMVDIDSDGVLIAGANLLRVSSSAANTAASFLVEIEASGNFTNSTDGTCLRVVDSGTAAGTSYAAYVDSSANSGLKVVTGAVGTTNITCVGPASQTAPIMLIDGATGPWVGVAGSGMLELTSDGVLAATTTNLLRIEHSGNAGGTAVLGNCFSANDTGAASGESYAGYISSTNNNGLQIATGATGDINLLLTSSAAGVDNMLDVDGTTGTWVGANDVGCAHIHTDGVLAAGANLLRVSQATGAPTAASHLVEIVGAGAWAGSTLGTCLNITDTGAVAGTSYAAYIASTANNGLNIVTGAVATSNLVMTGVQAQTSSMAVIDGSTGTGWDGANDVGCLHINTIVQNNAGATALFVDHAAQPISAAEGACARFIQSAGSAQTNAYLVEIEAITTGGALHVDSGYATFDESVTVAGGYLTKVTTVTTDNTDGAVTYTAAQMLGGLIIRGAGDELTGDQTDITATAANIVAAIPGAVVGSAFEFCVHVADSTHGILLDGNTGVTISPNDPATKITANSTGRFVAVCTNVTGASEAVTVYALGFTTH